MLLNSLTGPGTKRFERCKENRYLQMAKNEWQKMGQNLGFQMASSNTVKPRKWRTSLDGGWYLDLLFLKWRGKTSENGGF